MKGERTDRGLFLRSDRATVRLAGRVFKSICSEEREGERGRERERKRESSSVFLPRLPLSFSLPRRRGTKTAQRRRRRPTHYNARPVSWLRAECNASHWCRSQKVQETRGEGPSSLERAERRGRRAGSRCAPSGRASVHRPSVRSQQKGPCTNDVSRDVREVGLAKMTKERKVA